MGGAGRAGPWCCTKEGAKLQLFRASSLADLAKLLYIF
jgi:hypothetical protein